MINMIPSPKKYEQFDRICRLPCRIYTEVEAFQTGCQVFADAFRTLHGVELARERGGIELEALQIRINDITARINTLKQDKPTPPELTFDDAKIIFNNAKEVFLNTDDIERQRAILQSLIKKIVLSGNDIEIHWRFE